MKTMPWRRRFATLYIGLYALTALLIVGCDSNSTTIDTSALIGSYTFTQFVFRPDAAPGTLAPANVLDTLVVAETTLRFSANDRFLLDYRFTGAAGGSLFIEGTYKTSADNVDLTISGSFDNERRDLLLPREFSLRVLDDGARLEASIERNNIRLSDFSPRYNGIGDVDGTLELRLAKR